MFLEQTPKFAPQLNADEAQEQARLFKALSDPTRLRILSLLNRYEGKICVCELVECFPLQQPTISHHLHILREARIVGYQKRGNWIYYYIRRDRLQELSGLIKVFTHFHEESILE